MRNTDPFSDLIRSLEENLQSGGEGPPVDRERARPPQRGNPRRALWYLIPFLIFIFFNQIIGLLADWSWFDSLGLTSVFTTRIAARLSLFAVGGGLFWLFVALNIFLARRLDPRGLSGTPLEQIAAAFGLRVVPTLLAAAGALAFLVGLSVSAIWEDVLLYFNQSGFGLSDPVFGRDVGFFVFTLPIWKAVRTWLMAALVFSLAGAILASGIGWRGWEVRTRVLVHLGVLVSLILALMAWQYRINAYELVYSQRGPVYGAGYTDVKAQLPAYNILAIVTLVAAVALLATVFQRRAWRAMVALFVVWISVAVLAGNVFPGFVQRFQVSPNELNLERPYIEHNIRLTREAYDLTDIRVEDYEVQGRVTADALLEEASTLTNVRLWDYRPLLQTYNQVQALRQYYQFNDIDIDRYVINGERRQVMLAARELVPGNLSQDAQTWVNQRLVYTHGFGVAASPVAQVTRDGLPDFYVKDLPPQGAIPITRPHIYFGELTDSYVIGRTKEMEFSYPRGEGNVMTRFEADTGIAMSLWSRLLFAVRFADINMLLNSDIEPQSQLLWRRNIRERVQMVAPFLRYDRDPYIVIDSSGHLHWIHDAYTVSNRFPYSQPTQNINYIRNSVKIVTNAYDGSMRFYVVDDDDPIIAAYSRIFPDLFAPMSDMPDDLLAHLRYPADMFTIQATMYLTYHMTDPNEFYNREDMWAWPEEIFGSQPLLMEPYYVLMELPGEDKLEYLQILPFTPANRENMIAWLSAKSDPENYGDMLVFEFGKDSLHFGPKQIEARIDQDPTISAQLSLWSQQGSDVIRGNLLVIPVANSLVYVEPLYLQAANGRIPELKRVIVSDGEVVRMAENMGLAFVALYGSELLADASLQELATYGGALAVEQLVTSDGEIAMPALEMGLSQSLEELVDTANQHFARAQELAGQGDWTGYGREIDALRMTLEQLALAAGGQAQLPETAAPEQVVPDTASEETP